MAHRKKNKGIVLYPEIPETNKIKKIKSIPNRQYFNVTTTQLCFEVEAC